MRQSFIMFTALAIMVSTSVASAKKQLPTGSAALAKLNQYATDMRDRIGTKQNCSLEVKKYGNDGVALILTTEDNDTIRVYFDQKTKMVANEVSDDGSYNMSFKSGSGAKTVKASLTHMDDGNFGVDVSKGGKKYECEIEV